MFEKLLIANRGEIACRIAATARRMGIRTVAIYSDVDHGGLHVEACDEAVAIGGASSSESYLNIEKIINAAIQTASGAIHPGYGFLSENANFAKKCADAEIAFVGPPVEAIEVMGSKSEAKKLMETAGVPLVPGYYGDEQDVSYLSQEADRIGFPILVKASAGGGGRGMRIVENPDALAEAIVSAKREAKAAFSNDHLMIEKFISKPRHIEVQVFADTKGNAVHLFERDCSVQRRYQKVIEEAPASNLSAEIRERLFDSALTAVRAINYVGAGPIEFIVNADQFYFIEMNTRLQVEHSVTEAITGVDLVEWQLRIANGEKLPLNQSEITSEGHAIEARLYAEDPITFQPQAGIIKHLKLPFDKVRVDTAVRSGDAVSIYYDPMISKLTAYDAARAGAISKLLKAIENTEIDGLISNQQFLTRTLRHPKFKSGLIDTGFVEENANSLLKSNEPPGQIYQSLAVFLLLQQRFWEYEDICKKYNEIISPWDEKIGWRVNSPGLFKMDIISDGNKNALLLSMRRDGFQILEPFETELISPLVFWGSKNYGSLQFETGIKKIKLNFYSDLEHVTFFLEEQAISISSPLKTTLRDAAAVDEKSFAAPMPAKIVSVNVHDGSEVTAGTVLIILEAMKIEHPIRTTVSGVVETVFFAEGDIVEEGEQLLKFKPDGTN